MRNFVRKLRSKSASYLLWVALCFALTSAVYLSWLDRLVLLVGSPAADWYSMVAGYLLQAVGLAGAMFLLRKGQPLEPQRGFAFVVMLFAAMMIPVLLVRSTAAALGFGLVMNLLCGGIAGFYLFALALQVDDGHRGLAFGGGYAAATVAVGLLALIGQGRLLRGGVALVFYLPLTLGVLLATARLRPFAADPPSSEPAPDALQAKLLALACGVIVLISAVKNLGFGFPSTDIEAGLLPELSRLPYAVGLVIAGVINDKNRRNGLACTVAALIVPFLMLGLVGEPVPRAVFWGLDYIFYGFFSVFRVVLLLDLASRTRHWALAPLGLLAGRLGDAVGTGICLLLSQERLALVVLSAVLFFPAVFLLFRLYQKLYEPEAAQQRSEQEVFVAFCQHNDLSAREQDVLRMVLANHTNGEIAEALFISENTVKFHVRNVLQKTGCKNRNELQRKYALLLYPRLQAEP